MEELARRDFMLFEIEVRNISHLHSDSLGVFRKLAGGRMENYFLKR